MLDQILRSDRSRRRAAAPAALLVAALLAGQAAAAGGAPTGAEGVEARQLSRVVVQAVSTSQAAAAVARVGGTVGELLPIVDGVAATVPTTSVDRLRGLPGVRAVTPDARMQVQSDPTADTSGNGGSVVNREIDADVAHALGYTGKGVVVALVDTGISPSPDLMTADGTASRVLVVDDPLQADRSTTLEQTSAGAGLGTPVPDVDDVVGAPTRAPVACVDFSGEGHCDDSYGHGTFLAGLIAGNGAQSGGAHRGVAPEASLISVKIAGRDGSADVSKVLAGIQWVTSFAPTYRIRVLNLSLGTDSPVHHAVDPLNLAVQRAWASGLVVTVAASNRGPSAGSISKPGDDPLVITVGAVNDRGTPATDDDRVPDFSGRGPTRHGLVKPDVVAPGAKVVSLQAPGSALAAMPGAPAGPYRRGSGTSMATAVTSGAVALLLQHRPGLTPDAVKTRLRAGAERLQARDPLVVGSGLVNVVRAGLTSAVTVPQVRDAFATVGELDDSRGGVRVTPACTRAGDPLNPLRQLFCPEQLSDDTTGQLRRFDPEEFRDGEWTGNSWYESQWTGNSWYGNSWYGNSWYGNSWYGESDDGRAGSSAGAGTPFGVPLPGGAWYGAWEQ